MHILVVDDDPPSRMLVASILESVGHRTVSARDGVEALEIARADSFDLVITDVLMPRMDGFRLAQEWKNDPVLSMIPMIFTTASYLDPADERLAVQMGADAFISKPIDGNILLQLVSAVVAEARAGRVSPSANKEDSETLKAYTDRVVQKLEHKQLELERSNAILETAMLELSEQMEARQHLVDRLHSEVGRSEARALELQRALDLKDTILNNAEIFICATDAAGCIVLFSPGAERVSGHKAEELLGKDFVDTFVPEDRQANSRTFEKALLVSGEPARVSSRWRMRSGEIRSLETSVAPMHDEAGAVSGIIRFAVDVTIKNQMLAAERVMGVIDLATLSNLPVSELLRLTCLQAVSELDLSSAIVVDAGTDVVKVIAAAGDLEETDFEDELTSYLSQHPVRTATTWVSPASEESSLPATHSRAVMITPIAIEGRAGVALVASATKGTDFRGSIRQPIEMVAERIGVAMGYALAREKLLLQGAALDAAASGIVIAGIDGNVTWVNAAFEEMTGFNQSDVIGHNILEAESGYVEPELRAPWEAVRKGRRWRGESTNRTRDGREYPESLAVSPVQNTNGEPSHVVIVKSDISEARRFERLKSDFTAMVSHELRTPLTKISGYADLLERWDVLDEPSRTKAIAALRENALEMQVLVDKLLSAVHRRVREDNIRVRNIDLVRLVREVSTRQFENSTHVLTLSIPQFPSRIDVDPNQIETVLCNLLDNAVKYSPEGTKVSVSLRSADGWIVVAVSDEGLGIPSNDFEHMFESFVQGDMSSTREVGGLGLGLFIARELVAIHGGRINAIRNPGKGSTFEVHLPLSRGDSD